MLLHRPVVALKYVVPAFVQTLLLGVCERPIVGLEALLGAQLCPVNHHLEALIENDIGLLLGSVDVGLHHVGDILFPQLFGVHYN